MLIASIDIGYLNLGLVVCNVCPQRKKIIDCVFAKRINITHREHGMVKGHVVDHIQYLVDTYKDTIALCDKVLLERQPPQGLKDVEALLYHHYRDKAVLISPVSMHSALSMNHYDYEHRKRYTETLAEKFLDGHGVVGRIHDVADAIAMIIYWTSNHMVREKPTIATPFDEFRMTA